MSIHGFNDPNVSAIHGAAVEPVHSAASGRAESPSKANMQALKDAPRAGELTPAQKRAKMDALLPKFQSIYGGDNKPWGTGKTIAAFIVGTLLLPITVGLIIWDAKQTAKLDKMILQAAKDIYPKQEPVVADSMLRKNLRDIMNQVPQQMVAAPPEQGEMEAVEPQKAPNMRPEYEKLSEAQERIKAKFEHNKGQLEMLIDEDSSEEMRATKTNILFVYNQKVEALQRKLDAIKEKLDGDQPVTEKEIADMQALQRKMATVQSYVTEHYQTDLVSTVVFQLNTIKA